MSEQPANFVLVRNSSYFSSQKLCFKQQKCIPCKINQILFVASMSFELAVVYAVFYQYQFIIARSRF